MNKATSEHSTTSERATPHEEESTAEEPPSSGDGYTQPYLKRFFRSLSNILRLRKDSSLEESVAELIEEHEADGVPLRPEERTILTNAVSFRDLRVEDILVPRSDIIAISDTVSLEDLRQIILDKEHTRMPIYGNSLDEIKGFIHIKDLMRYLGEDTPFVIKDIIREILVVPPSMAVSNLLMQMRNARVHMALVVDEHGGTDGLVTIEDIVEEIVGEIEDEHDIHEEAAFKRLSKDSAEVNARLTIEDLEEMLAISLVPDGNEDDFDTVGGLIFNLARRVPATDEVIMHPNGLSFKILEADPRRIKRILIENISPSEKNKA